MNKNQLLPVADFVDLRMTTILECKIDILRPHHFEISLGLFIKWSKDMILEIDKGLEKKKKQKKVNDKQANN